MPFSASKAQSILSNNIGKYVGLLYSDPGNGTVNEPAISSVTGYTRGIVQGWDTSKSRQIANNSIIFMFECLQDLCTNGNFTHFACFNSANGGTPDYYGELVDSNGYPAEVDVKMGYVPLIRKHEMIIGLDKAALDTNY